MRTKNPFFAVSWPKGIQRPLFITDGDGDGGNPDDLGPDDQGGADGDDTSRGADTSRAAEPGAPNGDPNARPGSSSPAGGNQTGAGATVPSGRLRDANREIRRLQNELARAQQQQPATHQQQPPPRRFEDSLDPESRKIREDIFKIVPELALLQRFDPDKFDQIVTTLGETAARSEGTEKTFWTRNANQHLRELDKLVRDEYGANADPKAVRRFQAGFIDWLETDEDARERYLDGDPNLVADYWKETTGLIVEPIRSKTSQEAITRAQRVRGLPVMPKRGGAIGAPRRNEKPKPKTDDEVHEQAWDALNDRLAALSR
jgi:hypothetical protein